MRRLTGLRWALLALPMLVGAVLLLHGLTGGAAASSTVTEASHSVSHDHAGGVDAEHDHGHCAECQIGHVMAACVAVFVAVATITALRRVERPSSVAFELRARARWDRTWGFRLHPPEPAWVRLAVMRC